MGPGDPPGPQFAFAGLALLVIIPSSIVVLSAAAVGAIKSARGLIGSLRAPGQPALLLCITGLAIHAWPLLLAPVIVYFA
jgi:hypothetical protein